MSNFCKYYCFLICLVGAIFLFGFGLVLSSGYEYSHVDDKASGALSCYIASGIYIVYPIIFIIICMKNWLRPKKPPAPELVPLIALGPSINQSRS